MPFYYRKRKSGFNVSASKRGVRVSRGIGCLLPVIVFASACSGAALGTLVPSAAPASVAPTGAPTVSVSVAAVVSWPTVAAIRLGLEAAGYKPVADVTDDGVPRARVRGIEILGPDAEPAEIAIEIAAGRPELEDLQLVLPLLPAATRATILDTLEQTLKEVLVTGEQADRKVEIDEGRLEVTAFPDGTTYVFLYPASM